MPQDWNDQRRGRGWDDNRSYGAQEHDREGRAGDYPSQYAGMGGASTRNVDAHRLQDADHGDQDRFDHGRGRWNAPGTGGVGHERGAPEARGSMGGANVRRDDRAAFGGHGGSFRDPGTDFGRGQMAGNGGQLSSYGERYRDEDRGGQGGQRPGDAHHQVYEENYHNWRAEQMRRFDQDYHEFRQHRQERFNADFDEWRKSRSGAGSASASHSGSSSGGTGEQTKAGGQRPEDDNR